MSCRCGKCDTEIKCNGMPDEDGCWIEQYFHCKNCAGKLPQGMSPAEWSRIGVGFTIKGLQVWCYRCKMSIINLDFEGQKLSVIPSGL